MSVDTPSERPAETQAADAATKMSSESDAPTETDQRTTPPDTRDAQTDTPTQRLVRYENRPLDDINPPAETATPPAERTETATQHLLSSKRENPEPSPAHGEWAELPTTSDEQPRETKESTGTTDNQTDLREATNPPTGDRSASEPDQPTSALTADGVDQEPSDGPQRTNPTGSGNESNAAPDRPQEVVDTDRPAISQDYYSNIPPVDHRPYNEPAFDGPPTREQAVQGAVGDCGVISTFGAVAGHRPDAIRNAITDNGDGTYDITLHNIDPATPSDPVATPTGETTTYRISNELPVSLNEPGEPLAGARPDTSAWPALLEKIIAAEDQTWGKAEHVDWEHDWQTSTKFDVDKERRGEGLPPSPDTPPLGYNRIDIGSTEYGRADLLAKLTGEEAEVRPIPDQQNDPRAMLDELRGQLDDGKPVLVGSRDRRGGELEPFQHFAFGHVYEVTKIDGDAIHLRNPWGEADSPAPIDASIFLEYYRGNYTTFK